MPQQPIANYVDIEEIKRKHADEIPGNQPGDPEKAADVIISLSQIAEPPLRLLLGTDAVHYANYKVGLLQASIANNEAISFSTDFA